MISEATIEAYKNTSYLVYDKNITITIRVEQYNSELINFLENYNAESWIIITAWNPYSKKQLEIHENIKRQNDLILELKSYRTLLALGKPDNDNWKPEESLFVLDIEEEKINYLAKKFEQNAVVFGSKTQLPVLKFFKS